MGSIAATKTTGTVLVAFFAGMTAGVPDASSNSTLRPIRRSASLGNSPTLCPIPYSIKMFWPSTHPGFAAPCGADRGKSVADIRHATVRYGEPDRDVRERLDRRQMAVPRHRELR